MTKVELDDMARAYRRDEEITKEELKQEAEVYSYKLYHSKAWNPGEDMLVKSYLAGAEPREKRIAGLEAQIEEMKCWCNCKNCANYMISGKCPSFFRTGWCKNWEMTRSKK